MSSFTQNKQSTLCESRFGPFRRTTRSSTWPAGPASQTQDRPSASAARDSSSTEATPSGENASTSLDKDKNSQTATPEGSAAHSTPEGPNTSQVPSDDSSASDDKGKHLGTAVPPKPSSSHAGPSTASPAQREEMPLGGMLLLDIGKLGDGGCVSPWATTFWSALLTMSIVEDDS